MFFSFLKLVRNIYTTCQEELSFFLEDISIFKLLNENISIFNIITHSKEEVFT